MLRMLCDWIWPTLEGKVTVSAYVAPSPILDPTVAKEVFARLQAAVESEVDRMKSIDAKLMAVCSVAPICVTLLVAMVGFITSNKPETFTPLSVVGVTLVACYVALQFLRALLAAIAGLERRGIVVPT